MRNQRLQRKKRLKQYPQMRVKSQKRMKLIQRGSRRG